MADLLNIKRPTYTRYETGTNEPDADTIVRLADIFGVSVDYLLCRTDEKAKKSPPDGELLDEKTRLILSLLGRLSPADQEAVWKYVGFLAAQEGKAEDR
jgi:transcriptional regulator with XRE-family HTH domain